MEKFMKGFVISDLGKKEVGEGTFHYDVSKTMKEDAKDALKRLFKKKTTLFFDFGVGGRTLVKGSKMNSWPGFNRDLCLRIDLQKIHPEKIEQKTHTGKKEEREVKFANVQIQLNVKKRPSTIAQVHFECGKKIPKDVTECAFEKSMQYKKIMYVFESK